LSSALLQSSGAKMGVAAVAGGTVLLVLTSAGIPVLAVGVGLAAIGAGGAATASNWSKRRRAQAETTAVEVAQWRTHVAALQDKLARSEALARAALAPASLSALGAPPLGSGAGGGAAEAPLPPPPPPPAQPAPPARGAGASGWLRGRGGKPPAGPSAPAAPTATAAAAGGSAGGGGEGGGAGAGAIAAALAAERNQIPNHLREAFAQVRLAMQAEPTEWRLRAVYGSARLLEHCHEGGQAPLCALKGVVQVSGRGEDARA
jgi:pyruvate/2-oxoglutarate dehydrogenase complex dihydrolipoamide acyltransferase (E2) component